jgi:fatty-acyl-CoA synthase
MNTVNVEHRLTEALVEVAAEAERLEWSVGDLLRHAVDEAPQRTALIVHTAPGEAPLSWTYSELNGAAEQVAQALLRKFTIGDRIATWAAGKHELILLQLGAALAGLTLVTLNPACRREELRFLLKQSGSRGLFMDRVFRKLDNVAVIDLLRSDLPDLQTVVMFDQWADFTSRATRCPLPIVAADSPALICFTSGTTGKPKGVVLRHSGAVNNARYTQQRFRLNRGSVWLNLLPLFHIGGTVTNTLGCLSNVGTQILLPEFNPEAMLAAIEKHRVQIFMAVPTMLFRAFQSDRFATTDVSSVEVACTGGATVPPELVRQIRQRMRCSVQVMFGQTEAGGCMTLTHRGDDEDHICNTVGIVLGGSSMKVIRTNDGEIARTDEVGEICVRSPNVMAEYFRMPEMTAETLDGGGWVHTGDLGYMRSDGYVQVTGRLKDMIIRGGENIYPREIEDQLMEHSSVSQVSVFGVPDERWGEQVAAAIVAAPGAAVDGESLSTFLQDRIAGHKIPKVWLILDELPVNTSGKVQKFLLRDRYQATKDNESSQ